MQRENRNFRRAVEPEGNAYGADPPVDIELHMPELEVAFGVNLPHGWKHQRAQKGQADLTAVSVSGQDQIDQRTSRVPEHGIGVVGFMCHEDYRGVGKLWHGEVEPRIGGAGVVDSAEPEAGAIAFDSNVLVDEYWNPIGGERLDDQRRTHCGVVIAQAGVPQWAGKGAQDLAAAMYCPLADNKVEGTVGDEVSCEQNHVHGEVVDMLDDALEKRGLGELVQMDVTDLSDAEAMEVAGEVCNGDGPGDNIDLVTGDFP